MNIKLALRKLTEQAKDAVERKYKDDLIKKAVDNVL